MFKTQNNISALHSLTAAGWGLKKKIPKGSQAEFNADCEDDYRVLNMVINTVLIKVKLACYLTLFPENVTYF